MPRNLSNFTFKARLLTQPHGAGVPSIRWRRSLAVRAYHQPPHPLAAIRRKTGMGLPLGLHKQFWPVRLNLVHIAILATGKNNKLWACIHYRSEDDRQARCSNPISSWEGNSLRASNSLCNVLLLLFRLGLGIDGLGHDSPPHQVFIGTVYMRGPVADIDRGDQPHSVLAQLGECLACFRWHKRPGKLETARPRKEYHNAGE